jgi:hypothetical protein
MKALLIAAALASFSTTVTAAAGNTACPNFVRNAYTTTTPAKHVLRASHPAVADTLSKTHGLLPRELQKQYAEAYSYNMLKYCSINPNNGTWEASEYALDKANEEVFSE